VALVLGAIAIIVVAYVLIQGGSNDDSKDAATSTPAASTPATSSAPSDTSTPSTTSTGEAPAPPVPTVRVVDAKPQGGVKKLGFDKGDQIRFRVVSDTADEIHVPGYDLMKDVPKDGSVSFSFEGSIDGRFVVELEGRGEQIAELDVNP